jgi:rhamnose transport system substrate-binding protein/rhamnose transport system permease protein
MHLVRAALRAMFKTFRGKSHAWILVLALLLEVAVFSVVAPNFFSIENLFEVTRFSAELGLLAIALTPVIIAGGIDLSVGSMMGLAAVVFGALFKDWHVPLIPSAGLALLVGCAGGAINAVFIAGFEIPPLIVTLGTWSAFRGIAEGLTRGAVNYSGFPAGFLSLGQGYLGGLVPTQLLPFGAIAMAYFVFLHRSALGRTLFAIGLSAPNARYSGIPVRRRVALTYVLSGLVSSIAAIIYVARVGQAKSDAGSSYELDAIAAVVLGGTSIFGGRGTLKGTVLGLLVLSVLQNGLHLAALPTELTGIMTGVLLVAIIGLDRFRRRPAPAPATSAQEENSMKNTQLAILCGTILAGSLLVATTNIWLVHSLVAPNLTGQPSAIRDAPRRPTIAVMPKAKGDPYFVSCRKGAEEAAREFGGDLIWDGPTSLDAAKQNEIVENWITRRVDVIAVAVENRASISTVLRKARARGIKVLTWDADAEADARDYFVNQATPEGIANTLTDEAARLLGGRGTFAIITGALSAANQNEWIARIKTRLVEKYPGLTLAAVRPSDDDRDKAFSEAQTILKVYPHVRLLMAISAPAVPGAAEAVSQTGRKDIDVIGLSLPSISKAYIHSGVVQEIVLWNTTDLGYLVVAAGARLAQGGLQPGMHSLEAGRLGRVQVSATEIVLGTPLIINRGNVDSLDF